MSRPPFVALLAMSTILAAVSINSAVASPAPPTLCRFSTVGNAGNGTVTVDGSSSCHGGSTNPRQGLTTTEPLVKTIDCGPIQANPPPSIPGNDCSLIANDCAGLTSPIGGAGTTTVGYLTLQPNGAYQLMGRDCLAPISAHVTATNAYEQAKRLVPHPAIGIAPPGGKTLVNIETLFWVGTASDRFLGTVVLLGHRVDLKVTVIRVDWDFGDGTTAARDSPGRPYDDRDPCATPTCDDYWGHLYRRSGPMTVTATTTWTGRYRIDSGPWQTIAAPVTGPPTTLALTVREARAVIVRGPP